MMTTHEHTNQLNLNKINQDLATTDAPHFSGMTITGALNYTGGGKVVWKKYTANSVTLSAGTTPSSVVSNLQTANDGSYYHIDEAAGAPGINLIIDFINVSQFQWVNIIAAYRGSTTHANAVQLWNWVGSVWDTFHSIQDQTADLTTANGKILSSYNFIIPNNTNYIGTGGSAGQVRVRLYHTMTGNSAHDLDIDVVALYQ